MKIFSLLLFFLFAITQAAWEEEKSCVGENLNALDSIPNRKITTITPIRPETIKNTIYVFTIPLKRKRSFKEKIFCCSKVLPESHPVEQHLFLFKGRYYGEKTIWDRAVKKRYHLNRRTLLAFYKGTPGIEAEVREALKSSFKLVQEEWPAIFWEDMFPLDEDPTQFTWQHSSGFKEYVNNIKNPTSTILIVNRLIFKGRNPKNKKKNNSKPLQVLADFSK